VSLNRLASMLLKGALGLGCLGIALPARADSAQTQTRVVTRLAEGIYAIRHVDPLPGWVHGNTTVIIGTREVLVVDACQTLEAAREDIAQIQQWTKLPVRYLVNSHWHGDHWEGNQAYVEAYPGLATLAHRDTAELMAQAGPVMKRDALKDAQALIERSTQALASGKKGDGSPLNEADRRRVEQQAAQGRAMVVQLNAFQPQRPTLTFSEGLTLDLGGREVQVFHPGRGNTAGDVVVFVPKERILAAGDLIVQPVPYTFDGYPSEWIRTLERLVALDPAVIVPGHGDVLRDTGYVLRLRDLLQTVVRQVRAAFGESLQPDLEALRKTVDAKAFKEQLLAADPGDAPFFDYALKELIALAYHEAKAR